MYSLLVEQWQVHVWEHIAKLYYSDLHFGLHQLPKLTVEHIQLKSFSKMKVNFVVSKITQLPKLSNGTIHQVKRMKRQSFVK